MNRFQDLTQRFKKRIRKTRAPKHEGSTWVSAAPTLIEPGQLTAKGKKVEQVKQVEQDEQVKQAPNENISIPPPTLGFDGIKIWHDCDEAAFDIVFVHGLGGNRDSTWTSKGQQEPWPKTLLPASLKKQTRILTYGYDAHVVRLSVASKNGVLEHATNLLRDLADERSACPTRPLIFVAHSLGGIVSKQVILLSRDSPESHLQDVFESTIGIVFMGTPHRGSWMAQWARIPASALGLVKSTNGTLLRVLQTEDQLLQSIQSSFWSMVRKLREGNRMFQTMCFFEELRLPGVGFVVPKESATLEGYPMTGIHANHMDMVRFQSSEDTGYKRLVSELVRWQSNVQPKLDELTKKCLKSLAFHEMNNRLHDIEAAADGTFKWLFTHPVYKEWAAGDRALLWIKGNPGSGKSTLMRHVVKNFPVKDDALLVCHFFHGRGTDLQRSSLGFLRSLLHQLLSRVPRAFTEFLDRFEKRCEDSGLPGENWQWHGTELYNALVDSLPKMLKTQPVWLFVDALDECGEESAVQLVQQFQQLLRATSGGLKLHICFACRQYPILSLDSGFQIRMEDETGQDIATYVNSKSFSQKLSMVPELVTERAQGVFMWARLVLDRVFELERNGKSAKSILDEIRKIPNQLSGLYEGLITRMNDKPASLQLVQWVTFTMEPLTLEELPWAVSVDPDLNSPQTSLADVEAMEDFDSDWIQRVKSLSCGLIETVPLKDALVLQFVHQSAKDFFVQEGFLILDDTIKAKDTGTGIASSELVAQVVHYRLSRICIRYLTMCDNTEPLTRYHAMYQLNSVRAANDSVSLLAEFPFLSYAAAFWIDHARQGETTDALPSDLLAYLGPSESFVEPWTELYRLCGREARGIEDFYSTICAKTVHILALAGLSTTLQLFLQNYDPMDMDLNIRTKLGETPLTIASKQGHQAVVKHLLATGKVEVDATGAYGQTSLLEAAEYGHDDVVRLLLATGAADPNKKNTHSETPLYLAAQNGHLSVVKRLLATGVIELDLLDDTDTSPCLAAAQKGHEDIVELLLATGKVNIEAKNERGMTMLHHAAQGGHRGLVAALIRPGRLDINAKTIDLTTPLLLAAGAGQKSVVECLLATNKVEMDSSNTRGDTPLFAAVKKGASDIVSLLLATGPVDVNARAWSNSTPLHIAAIHGFPAVVELLLATEKVEIDPRDDCNRTPLHDAARNGHLTVAELLVATGKVEIDAKDEHGHTPFCFAAAAGFLKTAKLLFDTGQVDVDSKDNSGKSPLYYAARYRHRATVDFLLATGKVSIHSNGKGNSPVWDLKDLGYNVDDYDT